MGILGLVKEMLIRSPEAVGRQGERMTASTFGWVNFWGKQGKVLQNLYIPLENGGTTEIDLLYITAKGILVVESKNYSGYIFGSENNKNWTVTLYAGKDIFGRKQVEKHQFYNPILQNKIHIRALDQYLGYGVRSISIVVFSERCELKSISVMSPDVFVCKRNELSRVVRDIWGIYPDIMDEKQINIIFEKLQPLTNQSENVKEEHIKNVQLKRSSVEKCPWCGGNLILRRAKRGATPGSEFWGCSGYPSCKYTRNLMDLEKSILK